KVHQEKVQQDKLKAIKARLNFEEASQYSESGAPSKRRNLKERLGSRCARSISGSPKPRHGHSESPRKRGPERRTQSSGKDQAKLAKKGKISGKDKPLAILMVQPWQKVAKQKITQTFSLESVISFPSLGEEDETKGPMIIEAEMGGHFVYLMYVDRGSSLEIMYEHCFNKFRPEFRS
nr:reverse transcriptase domain-containing protein [Tanacetum cinerariifolium]